MTTAFGLYGAQERGQLFISAGVEVYEGMVVGQHIRERDLEVNVCKRKHLTNMRSAGADEALRLVPVRELTLEQAIEYVADDELVEVTPRAIRMRKKVLAANQRPKGRKE